MSDKIIKIKIDGREIAAKEGQNLLDAATENGVYIPYLCHMKGVCAAGSCRICNVKINGRYAAACTTPIDSSCEGWVVENKTPELDEMRKTIVEVLFVEGNHFCPSCEKSGNCDLQALAYKYQMMVPQFEYRFPKRVVDASSPKIYLDRNRCIQCKKCIRLIKDKDGKSYFAFFKRGHKLEIHIDQELAANMPDDLAQKAMDNCPVGAILKKEKGYDVPIGKRKYDKMPIGSDIEKN
jgi:[NiFe] hydrogenase diaphorase moiety small subunit